MGGFAQKQGSVFGILLYRKLVVVVRYRSAVRAVAMKGTQKMFLIQEKLYTFSSREATDNISVYAYSPRFTVVKHNLEINICNQRMVT